MFRKCFLFGSLLLLLFSTTKGQSLTVDSYSNQLLFNIFKEQPDTGIRNFLRLYAPTLYPKIPASANAASAIGNSQHSYTPEIHSFIFTKHPFFNASFASGKLELYCQHFNDSRGVQVYDVKLWFEFDIQQEAEIAYSKLIETFIPISSNKKIDSMNGFMRGQFSDANTTKGFNKIQFRLTADNLTHRFKILFETQNEL
jgi:hypothetical protein